MKRTLLFLVLALVTGAAITLLSSCKANEPKLELKVVSYNIRYGTAKDGGNSWEFRKTATPAMIDSLKPDLLGLQEAMRFQIDYILENCPDYAFYGVGRDDGGVKGEHTAVLYNKNVFKFIDGQNFWLSQTPDVPSRGWDSRHHRTATMVHLEHIGTGRELYYVNTHLDHEGPDAQRNGLQLIIDKIDTLNTHDVPMVLTGDFNMTLDNPSMSPLKDRLMNARLNAAQTDTLYSFNDWVDIYEAATPAHLYGRGDNRIDYIYYSPDGRCDKYVTDTTTYLGIPYVSDHYPIVAEIVF